jgi:conjugative transposon TraJ protein
MRKWKFAAVLTMIMVVTVSLAHAQAVGTNSFLDQVNGFHAVLQDIYDKLIKQSEKLILVGSGIAGFGALVYISSKVFRSLANAEPIDFYPLLRPFALGLCIMFFSELLGMMNGILQPTVDATNEMVNNSDKAVHALIMKQKDAIAKDHLEALTFGMVKYTDEEFQKYKERIGATDKDLSKVIPDGYGVGMNSIFTSQSMMSSFKTSVKASLSEILQILFAAASLCLNTIRTFQLVVLGILGPVVFGLAVFDGFQHTLAAWFAKYVNIFLWLPVCNIFGALIGTIQEEMLKMDAAQMAKTGVTSFGLTDTPYLIFLVIGIVGYLTVPTVAGYIVNAGGAGAMVQKITSMATSVASSGTSRMAQGAGNIADIGQNVAGGHEGTMGYEGKGVAAGIGRLLGSQGVGSGLMGKSSGEKSGGGNFMGNKLAGDNGKKKS